MGCSVQQSWISLGDNVAGVSDTCDDSISVSFVLFSLVVVVVVVAVAVLLMW